LIGQGTVEDNGGGFAPGFGGLEDAEGGGAGQEMADKGFALFGTDERAVVDDHGKRGFDLLGNGHGEVVAAAGDEGDFNAAAGGFGNGGAVACGDSEAAAEERAVNIERDELHGHTSILADSRGGAGENSCVRLFCVTTRRLYYDDAYLQNFDARVLACSPAEPVQGALGMQPAWEVLLDQTAFYPTSGGQPNDLGLLGEAVLLDVRDGEEGIAHIVDRELEKNGVKGCVNWPRRFDHMQQHTGQHLLSAMFQGRFGLPTVSFHLGVETCTIDLHGGEPSRDLLIGAQRAANKVIFEDRGVTVRYGTREQLARLGVRKEVEREGLLRAIEIEDADLQPCGGTHVKSTGQIGMILVRGCSKVRQDWRVEFVCGRRAEQAGTEDFERERGLMGVLGCALDELPAAVERLTAERDANFKSLRGALQQLAGLWGGQLASTAPAGANGVRVASLLLRGAHPELLLPLATEIAKSERTIALLILEESGQLVFAQHPTAGKDLGAVLKSVLAVHPGKGGGSKDFVRAKLAEAGSSAAALELAKSIVAA
jgi:alanyl-tRNA synthetase